MSDEKYCISMRDQPRQHPNHTLPLVLIANEKEPDAKPALFTDIETAVQAARGYKEWHPEIIFDVFPFFRPIKYVYELMEYGSWMIGKDPVRSV